MSESERRVGWAVQERAPTLASLRFGLPSPLLAHARGGGMGTTGASSSSDEAMRTTDVDGYRYAPPILRLDYVGPLSSSAKADDPVPRGGPVRQPASPLDPSPAERAGRVARRERKRTACRVGVQEKAPTLASLHFGLPSPLLAHARGGGMGTTGASSSSDETSRTADVDGYRCAPPIRRIDVVGPLSSSAKADDPVPRRRACPATGVTS